MGRPGEAAGRSLRTSRTEGQRLQAHDNNKDDFDYIVDFRNAQTLRVFLCLCSLFGRNDQEDAADTDDCSREEADGLRKKGTRDVS